MKTNKDNEDIFQKKGSIKNYLQCPSQSQDKSKDIIVKRNKREGKIPAQNTYGGKTVCKRPFSISVV